MDVDATLEAAVAHHRAGRIDQAVDGYRQALVRDPEHVEALQLLGAALLRLGRPADALPHLTRAVTRDPEHAPALLNHGRALAALERTTEARASLERAVAVRPGFGEALADLARLLLLLEVRDEAVRVAEQAVRARPQAADPWRVLGAALLDVGRPGEAGRAFQESLGRQPANAEAWLGLGRAAFDLGQLAAARQAWTTALERDPTLGAAAQSLATLATLEGRADDALAHAAAAVRTPDPPPGAWVTFADAVSGVADVPEAVAPLLIACLRRPDVDAQRIERAVRARILAAPALAAEAPRFGHGGEPALLPAAKAALLADPLLPALLRRAIVQDPALEGMLRALRSELVQAAARGDDVPVDLLVAMAWHAWHTEHAWWTSPADRAAADALVGRTEVGAIAALATLEPLDRVAALAADPAWRASAVGELLAEQVDGMAEERALAAAMPVVAMTDDAVSAAVRAQYEENPYPRLVGLHRKPAEPLSRVLRALFPWFDGAPPGPVDVLVAGCGTGQQVLSAASRYAGARVLGVDLSRRSLAVAARQVRRWGLDVELAQADLLALGDLGTFDLVEAGGVLHHLDDPLAGWRVLVGLVKPGGLMKIALYSEAGRRAVVAAREVVAHASLDADGLRDARRALLALPADHPARPVTASIDLYSLSGLRDLVFHACEHRFTLPGISAALDALGLELIGLQHPRPEPVAWYRERFPDDVQQRDLARWAAVEADHPEVFAGMFQFWVRRP